jgi:hypothetical protein
MARFVPVRSSLDRPRTPHGGPVGRIADDIDVQHPNDIGVFENGADRAPERLLFAPNGLKGRPGVKTGRLPTKRWNHRPS